MIICRCEEVLLSEIEEAIRDGAADLNGIKRRTRAGMGLCQGQTCRRHLEGVLRSKLGTPPGPASVRPPLFPIPMEAVTGLREGPQEGPRWGEE